MATRAIYSFTGFPDAPVRHLYLHHDGYPTGAAWRFATALREGGDASTFLSSFLSSQSGGGTSGRAGAGCRRRLPLSADAGGPPRSPPAGGVLAAAAGGDQLAAPLRPDAPGQLHPALPAR
ncbi:hypothetical protein [Synechococcus sp. CS-1328]|uniref:hypothetical protein n=1 Tax=Synechococcus sp. CS-1328 TaxID=2847976 RepID=UPI00223C3917|nr:hypothetical protein [Synechococcus sp. CS-1328]